MLRAVLSCALSDLDCRNPVTTAEPAPAYEWAEHSEFCGKAWVGCVDAAQWNDDFSASTIAAVQVQMQLQFRGIVGRYCISYRMKQIALVALRHCRRDEVSPYFE